MVFGGVVSEANVAQALVRDVPMHLSSTAQRRLQTRPRDNGDESVDLGKLTDERAAGWAAPVRQAYGLQ